MLILFLFSKILIPMDANQLDHLRAYGMVYKSLQANIKAEWLLNYKGGAFLLDDNPLSEKLCKTKGVSYEIISDARVQSIYSTIESENMERVELTMAPRIAVYTPPYSSPWDDAVTLALEYADIPYAKLWDEQVINGSLSEYDWLHLHHEDFTGQYGKFYGSFSITPWFKEEVKKNEIEAKKLGYKKVWQLKHDVARKISEYVNNGGFLFAMCSATETIDIAIAAYGIDIVPLVDGDGFDRTCQKKLNFNNTFAFKDIEVDIDPMRYRHSNIDVSDEARMRGENVFFELSEFSAKYDPIPTLLIQDHTNLIREFMGQTTGFRKNLIKPGVVILGEVKGTTEVKYLYGDCGKGFFAFYGGHDPEDYTHMVGDIPTRLELYPNSPGYRLILNNVLFPAAKSKRLKT